MQIFKKAAVLVIVAAGLASGALAQEQKQINIQAQPLLQAVDELSAETGTPILVRRDLLDGLRSASVSGIMSTQRALEKMIAETNLPVRQMPDNSLVISGFDVVSQNSAIDDQIFDLGTIVLQGERVERDVFNTTSSVRAYGEEELEQNVQSTSLDRVISDAGNITTFEGSNETIFIRGHSASGPNSVQGAFLEGSFPRANLTVDGRTQTFSELSFSRTSIWDLETVEVFRGPQTTTQGANAIAGAINVRTKDPVFERETAFRTEVGTDSKIVASAMFNAPLSDSVAVRFALDYQEQDPFINYPLGVAAGLGVLTSEQLTARFKLLWEPAEVPELSTKLTLSYTEYDGAQTFNVRAPFSELNSTATSQFPSTFSGNTVALIHDFRYDLGGGISVRNQFTYSDAENTRSTNGGPGPLNADRPLDTEAISNELVLDYAPEGSPLTAIAGVFFREAEDSAPPGSFFTLDGTNTNLGIFGEATYRFNNGFDVTGGLRYEKTEQDRFVEIAAFGLTGPNALDYEGDFDAVLPKLAIGYEPNDDLRFAFQVSKGFNPGGIGTSFGAILGTIPLPSPFVPFDEETVINYELSMRGRFLDDRLFVAANLFYSDFEDYQFAISTVLPSGDIDSIISNAERVETYGLEVDAQFQATDRLQLIGSLGLLHTEVKEFNSAAIVIIGNELPFAPNFTASLGFDYAVTDRFFAGGQLRHSGEYFSDITNDPGDKTSALTTLDLQARYALSDTAEVYAYVNNVADTIQGVEIFGNGTSGVTNRPREIGFGVRANW